ncbi:hypothetical protein HUG17_7074 [Dermatophagoides farinae]|uniref:Uncharacterized protein n=1 Tax=Dermatophagoides farinae TaxID=6954 RepID=A0A9D4NQ83_DERFA|nr:hypothetical protein HUG17_7074 [Dermatophagoides farinae]
MDDFPNRPLKAQGSSPPVKKSRIDEPCQIEHILLRPNIGSVEKVTKQMWVYDSQWF